MNITFPYMNIFTNGFLNIASYYLNYFRYKIYKSNTTKLHYIFSTNYALGSCICSELLDYLEPRIWTFCFDHDFMVTW